MSLIQVGARRGRSTGVGAGLAVAAADATLAVVALLLIGFGAATMPALATAMTILGVTTMVASGALLMLRPKAVEALVGTITRPAITLFGLTALTPTTLLGWIALLGAVPVDTTVQRVVIAAGVVTFSSMWHPAIGLAAAAAGRRISEQALRIATRAGGFGLCLLGGAFAVI